MGSRIAQAIVRDVLLAVGSRSNEQDMEIAAHNVDATLAEVRELLNDCDSNLSAYGHGRPLTKRDALDLSDRCRLLYDRMKVSQ
jgi:hypothetical protein